MPEVVAVLLLRDIEPRKVDILVVQDGATSRVEIRSKVLAVQL